MDPLTGLHDADARLAGLVARLDADTLTAPTPCANWDVRAMLSHTLQSVEAFSAAVDGGDGPDEAELFSGHDILGDDPAAVTRRITARSQAAWAAWNAARGMDESVTTVLGAMPGAQALGIVTFSTLIHSWDLAVAMGEKVEFTADEAALADAVAAGLVPNTRPAGLFADEVAVPSGATPTERVIAFTGRAPL